MSAEFSAEDLRSIADALDGLTETTIRTGVTVASYSDDHITLRDHVIRMRWVSGASQEPGRGGRYVIEFPDKV